MTIEDYQATGINTFEKLESLLKTRRKMLQALINTVDASDNKDTAYDALKVARLHFDKAVFDELQKLLAHYKNQFEE